MLDISANRRRFPRGLVQPGGSFRVCQDTLLLAGYAHKVLPGNVSSIAELGCGNGACLCGVGLFRCFTGIGFDCEEDLLHAARTNSAALGLDDSLYFRRGDVRSSKDFALFLGRFDAVLVNPPYYEVSEGRASKTPLRDAAMRGDGLLPFFCQQASRLLRHHGYFVSIFPARRMPILLHACETYGLGVRRMQPLASYPGECANRILLLARKDAQHDCLMEPMIVLHATDQEHPGSGRKGGRPKERLHEGSKEGAKEKSNDLTKEGSQKEGCPNARRNSAQWTWEAKILCPWLCHDGDGNRDEDEEGEGEADGQETNSRNTAEDNSVTSVKSNEAEQFRDTGEPTASLNDFTNGPTHDPANDPLDTLSNGLSDDCSKDCSSVPPNATDAEDRAGRP